MAAENVHLAGNTSIDACLRAMDFFNQETLIDFSLENENYILLTIHRQENTTYNGLKEILSAINSISKKIKVLFPAHLRTRKVISEHKMEIGDNVIITDPLGYKDFMGVLANSKFVMTDSGGIQEEAAVLNVPCLILRDNTEWMFYVDMGKNLLLGTDHQEIINVVTDLLDNNEKLEKIKQIKIPFKQGASKSIVSILKNTNKE
jgi:UDP-N-acetylglucosamine 2-epimerase (non-hydrolysing)